MQSNTEIVESRGFFVTLKDRYGERTCNLAKEWFKNTVKLARIKNRRIFLLQCRLKNIYPKHIINNFKCTYSLLIEEHPFKKKVNGIMNRFKRSILNLEIEITIWRYKQINDCINKLRYELSEMVSQETFINTCNCINQKFNTEFRKIRTVQINKLRRLVIDQRPHTSEYQDKFIFNDTDVELPNEVKNILSLGPKFGIPYESSELPIPIIIKDLEFAIAAQFVDESEKNHIRARTTNIITNHYNKMPHKQQQQREVIKDFHITKKFFKQHPEIVTSNADKGNKTVIMYREEYDKKLLEMLSDSSTYEISGRDPTRKYQTQANKFVEDLKRSGVIDSKQEKTLKIHNAVTPKIYGLRKTHKNGFQLRPVVSCIGSPSYNIASWIHQTLSPITTTFEYNIKNSFDFVDFIQEVTLPEKHILISLDVVSLFTNIPKQLVVDIVTKQWKYISAYTNIEKDLFLDIVSFCFDSSYFSFKGVTYSQKDGSAMGNPVSPTFANIVMNELVISTLRKLPFKLPFIRIYVDDTILAIPEGQENLVLQLFNQFHSKLKFTLEREQDQKISFLDLEITRQDNGQLLTNWYTKSSYSGRLLNFRSNHPISTKVGIIKGLLNRVYSLSHPVFHQNNLERIKELLHMNNYPTSFVNKVLNEFHRNDGKNKSLPSIRFYKFPYIEGLSHKIARCFNNEHTKLAFYNLRTVRDVFTKLKDSTPYDLQSQVVYKIPCSCGNCYIGQTKQYLKERLRQHRNDCREQHTSKQEKTALACHHFETGHNFLFDQTRILDHESNFFKRGISEMIYINITDNTVNMRSDVQHLSSIYCNLLNSYKNTNQKNSLPLQ